MAKVDLNRIIGLYLIIIMGLLLLRVSFGVLTVPVYGVTLIAGVLLLLNR